MNRRVEVEQSCGNVFEDLGLPNAEERLAKADLAIRISEIMKKRCLTQAQTATILGVSQPNVSDLTRGKLDGFTMDRLFRFLNSLDQEVQIVVRQRPRNHCSSRIFVTTAGKTSDDQALMNNHPTPPFR